MSKQHTQRTTPVWLLPTIVVGLVAALVVGALLMRPGTEQSAQPTTPPTSAAAPSAPTEIEGPAQPELGDIAQRNPADLLAIGPVDAPVSMVVFSDYQCQFCARWSTETLPQMMKYAEAGDLRIEWRDVNVFGEASKRGARASYAAALQGKFWEFHDALFEGGKNRPESGLTNESLIALAVELGLDGDQFATDLAAPDTVATIDANAQLGLDLGAYSTPAFVLGGKPIVGAQPSQIFIDAFEQALAASKN